ncbi:MAG: YicC/YloC family endoribonuclease [Candidatus Omnitrophota bacterium]
MKSMTGFAQGRFEFGTLSLNIILKSLNHRFLEINFRGTGINPTTEKWIKDIIKGKIVRGKLDIVFDLYDSNERKCNIFFNEHLTANVLDELLFFKQRYKDKISLSMDSLLRIPMIFRIDSGTENYTEEEKAFIHQSVEKILNDFLASRETEGRSILTDMTESIERIETSLASIIHESETLERDLFLKFKEKITKYIKEQDIDERRIVQEAAILAEKSCINEEINRLETHNRRLKELLWDHTLDAKGREADFLAQEMQRETHTIASKVTSMEVHRQVLLIRREIEKIKQQVQNVE